MMSEKIRKYTNHCIKSGIFYDNLLYIFFHNVKKEKGKISKIENEIKVE